MFVGFGFRHIREVENLARAKHRFGKRRLFAIRHAFEKDRHQQGGALIVGNRAAGDAVDKELDFVAREFRAVSFSANDVLWSQTKVLCGFAAGCFSAALPPGWFSSALPPDVRKGSAFPFFPMAP